MNVLQSAIQLRKKNCHQFPPHHKIPRHCHWHIQGIWRMLWISCEAGHLPVTIHSNMSLHDVTIGPVRWGGGLDMTFVVTRTINPKIQFQFNFISLVKHFKKLQTQINFRKMCTIYLNFLSKIRLFSSQAGPNQLLELHCSKNDVIPIASFVRQQALTGWQRMVLNGCVWCKRKRQLLFLTPYAVSLRI